MDNDRRKNAAEWFRGNVFRDEAIRPRPAPAERVPSLIRAARSLENGWHNTWQSREATFLKQGKLLAEYEDDYEYHGNVIRYFPTYQSLTDGELRGYFTWRTKYRRGTVEKTFLSYAFLYIYELLNLIGVNSAMEGYRKLEEFRRVYGPLDSGVLPYLDQWIRDFVIYHGLDANLLADSRQAAFDRNLTILDHIHEQPAEKVLYAVRQLAPNWLDRSKFYAAHREDCDEVILRVLRGMSERYAARCKRGFVEQYFGTPGRYQVRLFDSAVFCGPRARGNREYVLDQRCVYHCRDGVWTVEKIPVPPRPNKKLGDLLKAIDAIMREESGYGHPIKYDLETKWLLKLIREEVRALLEEKKANEAKKITIDFSRLDAIRRDADATREKLTVEEAPEEALPPEPEPIPEPAPAAGDCPLSPEEYRLMQCLLYGRDLGWVRAEGYMMSVLLDSINDKLYETFLDTVADDTPAVAEDYIDDLKEMVRP